MARAPKQCAGGCGTRVVARTYCDACTPVGWVSGGRSRTSTREHRQWRTEVLRRDRGSCRLRLPGCTGRAIEADHVVPVARGGAEFDVANGQAACPSCHQRKTQAEAREGLTLARTVAGRPLPE